MIRVELADRTVRAHGGDNLTIEVLGPGYLQVADADTARVAGLYLPGVWSAAMQAPDDETGAVPVPHAPMPVARAESVAAAWCAAHGIDLSDDERAHLAALLVEVVGSQTPEADRLPRVGDALTEADGARWDVDRTRYSHGDGMARLVVEYVHSRPAVGQHLVEGPS